MWRIPKQSYTNEFKLEAVRLVDSGQRPAAVAKQLGISEQTLANWRKAAKAGKLGKGTGKPISAEQMELSRLRAENSRLKMEMEILKNRPRGLPRPICVETSGAYTDSTPGQRPLAFWRRMSPSKNLAQGKLRTQLWWHVA